jgi:FkbM family methyltransferase
MTNLSPSLKRLSHNLKRVTYNAALTGVIRSLGLRPLARTVYHALFAPKHGQFRVISNGVSVAFWIRDAIEHRWVEGLWLQEKDFIDALTGSLKPGDVFLDIGANVGIHSVFAGARVGQAGRVLAYEPEETASARLVQNAALNGLSDVVWVLKAALSDRPGRFTFVSSRGRLAESGRARLAESGESGDATVDVFRGDDHLEQINAPCPTVVKIDVEGHEYSVLQGLRKTLSRAECRLLLCELHPRNLPRDLTTSTVRALVESFGFTELGIEERNTELHLTARRAV